MKKTYKCKGCGNEVVAIMKPSHCDICPDGIGNWTILATSKPINSGDESMAIDKDVFSSSKFRSTIEAYCRAVGWKIFNIDNKCAIIRFDMESGSTQTVFIIKYDSTLEFSCPTGLKFENIDDIPHQLSTLLLSKNSEYKVGFWAIEKISGKQVFSIVHNAEMTLIDVDYFRRVVLKLIQECDELEQAIESLI